MAAIVASRKATFGYALVDVTSIGQCGFTIRLSRFDLPAAAPYLRGLLVGPESGDDHRILFLTSSTCSLFFFTSILDRIHQSTTALDSDATYLLRRLPIKIGEGEEAARELLTRSFISFRRRQSGNVDWITARVDAAMAARRRITSFTDSVTWEDELAATAGILNAEHIRAIAASLDLTDDVHSRTTPSWIDWGLDWLVEHPDAFGEVVREENIISVFGKSAEGFQNDADKTQEILDKIRKVLPLWMGGIPLTGIEKALTSKPSKKCDVGREWSIRLVPDLAYFFGLIPQVYRRMKEAQGGIAAILASAIPNSFLTLGRCVREGFDHPDKTALHHVLGATVPRVVTHQNFALIADILESGPDYEPFSDTVRRVRLAWKQRPASH